MNQKEWHIIVSARDELNNAAALASAMYVQSGYKDEDLKIDARRWNNAAEELDRLLRASGY